MERKGERMLAQTVGARVARGVFVIGTLRPIIKHYVHPKVTGLENLLELQPPFLLAANHSSHMDTPLILMSLPRELRHRTLVAAASDYFYSRRLLGAFVSMAVGAVPIERRAASRQTMARVNRLLSQKWCLVMFPEGSRTPDGRLYRGKTGIARVALSAGVPVVPVGIVGTYQSMPSGRSWPEPGQVEVRFGKPISIDQFPRDAAKRIVLRAMADQIMHEIMTLTELTYVDQYVNQVKARPSPDPRDPS
jgi:1-acyl-sn-glycerol-3-phosphate acyltransferase